MHLTPFEKRRRQAQLRRSEIFIATISPTGTSSARSGIEGGSRLDVAPTELITFFWLKAIKIWPRCRFLNSLLGLRQERANDGTSDITMTII